MVAQGRVSVWKLPTVADCAGGRRPRRSPPLAHCPRGSGGSTETAVQGRGTALPSLRPPERRVLVEAAETARGGVGTAGGRPATCLLGVEFGMCHLLLLDQSCACTPYPLSERELPGEGSSEGRVTPVGSSCFWGSGTLATRPLPQGSW